MLCHTAYRVADKRCTAFLCKYGVPQKIHTDQGRDFESLLFSSLCKSLAVEKTRTIPYRPQTDGMIERFNRTLQDMLSAFVNENRDDWDDHLPNIMTGYRATLHKSTNCSPNLLMMNREVSLPIDIMMDLPLNTSSDKCPVMYIEWLKNTMRNAFNFANIHLQSALQRQKLDHDVNAKNRQFNP